jgi:hypothetical protein
MHDPELEQFKRDIDLVEYATERGGYRRDRRESSKHCHVLRRAEGDDKIVVRLDPQDGHWTYFSVRDGRDHGTIVDFVQHRGARRLGDVRQELRAWLGLARGLPSRPTCQEPAPRVYPRAAQAFAEARAVDGNPYLQARGLRLETLSDPRFAETWRVDRRGNVLFVHRDAGGVITGFEVKNRGFTGFCPGGHKSAWQSVARDDDGVIVVTESAIDALSHHQLHRLAGVRYLSTAGTLSAVQRTTLSALFERLPRSALVVAAVDADLGGDALAAELEQMSRHAHCHCTRHSPHPADGKDWNEVLQRCARTYEPSVPAEILALLAPTP